MDLRRYAGQKVEIIYMDQSGGFTQRVIRIREVRDGIVLAYCFTRRAPRAFRAEQILAVSAVPAGRRRRGTA